MNQNQRQPPFQSQQKQQQIIKYTVKKDTPKPIEQLLKLIFQYCRKIFKAQTICWIQRGQNQLKVQSLSGQQIVQLFSYVDTFEQTEFRIHQCFYQEIGSNLIRSISHITFTNLKSISFNFLHPDYDYDSFIGFEIDNIEPLTYMKLDSLQDLCFGYNYISSLKPLAHAYFPALRHLRLGGLNHSQMYHLTRLTSINLQGCLIEQAYNNSQEINKLYFNDVFKLQSTKINTPFNTHRWMINLRQPPNRKNYEKMDSKFVKKYPNYLQFYQEIEEIFR